MLNIFPALLAYGLLAPLAIRVFVGLVFFVAGYRRLLRRIGHADAMTVPPHPTALKVPLGIVEIVTGIALVVGAYTQLAAIAGAALSLAYMICASRGIIVPGGRSMRLALFVMSLSLLVTGAGAFAFDIPL